MGSRNAADFKTLVSDSGAISHLVAPDFTCAALPQKLPVLAEMGGASSRACSCRDRWDEEPLRAKDSAASDKTLVRAETQTTSFKKKRIMSVTARFADRRASRATVVAANGDAMDSTKPVRPLPRHTPFIGAMVLNGRRIAPAARLFHTVLTTFLGLFLVARGFFIAGVLAAIIVITHATVSWVLAVRIAQLPNPFASCFTPSADTSLRLKGSNMGNKRSKTSGKLLTRQVTISAPTGSASDSAGLPSSAKSVRLEPGQSTRALGGGTALAADLESGPEPAPQLAGAPAAADAAADEALDPAELTAAEEASMRAAKMSDLLFWLLVTLGPASSVVIDLLLALHALRAYEKEPSAAGKLPKELVAEARADKEEGDSAAGGYLLRTLAVRRAPVHVVCEAIPSALLALGVLLSAAWLWPHPPAPPELAAAVLLSGLLQAIAHALAALRAAHMLGGWSAYIDEVLGLPDPALMLPLLQMHAGIAHAPMVGYERLASSQRTAQLATALAASPWITAVGIGGIWLPLPRAMRPDGPDGTKLAGLGLRDVHARLCAAVLASSASAYPEGSLKLRVLSLARNRIGDSGAGALAALLAARGCELAALDLSDNRISDIGAGALGAGAKRGGSLATLMLTSNRVSAQGAAALILAAFPHGPIRALSLSQNRLGDAGLNAFATAIEDGVILNELDLRSVRPRAKLRAPLLGKDPRAWLGGTRLGGPRLGD